MRMCEPEGKAQIYDCSCIQSIVIWQQNLLASPWVGPFRGQVAPWDIGASREELVSNIQRIAAIGTLVLNAMPILLSILA